MTTTEAANSTSDVVAANNESSNCNAEASPGSTSPSGNSEDATPATAPPCAETGPFAEGSDANPRLILNNPQPYSMERATTLPINSNNGESTEENIPLVRPTSFSPTRERVPVTELGSASTKKNKKKPPPIKTGSPKACNNDATDINSKLDTQVEVRVYPCNNSQSTKKKFTQFMVKPEGVIIQGTNKTRTNANDLGAEYARHIGRKLQRYELSDTRACQLLVTTHAKSFWVVPAPEAFSRHSGTCRLLGDRKHPVASHTLQVGDFLRVGSVGVVVIETHDGVENRILSEEKIQKIMRDTTNSNGGFLDIGDTDGGEFLYFHIMRFQFRCQMDTNFFVYRKLG